MTEIKVGTKEYFNNTKFRVTPEQSEAFQKVLAEIGIGFLGSIDHQGCYNMPFLFIDDEGELTHNGSSIHGLGEVDFSTYPYKELDVMDYIYLPKYKSTDWILDMVKAGLEGEIIMYGDEPSTVFARVIQELAKSMSLEANYSILDTKQGVRQKISDLQQQIKDLEEEL